uniref:G-protein coupled receptors family 1 profile domain-containing protein n=1 Tax=Oryzias sinensis TaxID=183150 RepID=A0A8C8DFH6_9TELE
MASSVSLLLWLLLPLLLIDATHAAQRPEQQSSTAEQLDVKPQQAWTSRQGRRLDEMHTSERSMVPPEMLDLDQDHQRRLARGAEEEEQQSTFSHSFENEWVTTPQVTEFSNITKVESVGNSSNPDGAPGLFNPFYPLAESLYVAYAVLFLAGLVLAVGVVANMAVMCIVWNNYYMRSAWNYLLASMAFWDFMVLVLCLPVVVLNHLTHRRILGDITCRMVPYMEVVSLGITSFTLCCLGIARFHAATSSSQSNGRRVERCLSVLLKLLLVWLTAVTLASPEIFLWQLSQAVSPSTSHMVDSCIITPSSPLALYLILASTQIHACAHLYLYA